MNNDCPICKGIGWVCEIHPFVPWDPPAYPCCGGAVGQPCDCNPGAELPADYQSLASTYASARQ